tara:strand:- start:193 stop:471 length:279 start_codon:yes stop_codon:yes gene_type:complete
VGSRVVDTVRALRGWVVFDRMPREGLASASVSLRRYGAVRSILSAHGFELISSDYDGPDGWVGRFEFDGVTLMLRVGEPGFETVDGWMLEVR